MAYLDLAADDRLETRLPRRLKQDAEAIARAKGISLSQWVLAAMAEKAEAEFGETLTWQLTPGESVRLAEALAAPAQDTIALQRATARSLAIFGSDLP